MVFGRNSCEKRQIWVSEPHIGEVRVMHDLSWWLFGKPSQLSIRINWTFFAIYYDSGIM